MSVWRDDALDILLDLLEDDEADLRRAYELGVRAGRLAAALLWPLDRAGVFEEGRLAGRAEGFQAGLRAAKPRAARSEVA